MLAIIMFLNLKGLAAVCHCFYINFSLYKRYIHTSFIHKHWLRPFSILRSCRLSGVRYELGPALHQATALLTEPLDNNLSILYLVQFLHASFLSAGFDTFLRVSALASIGWRIVQILRQRRRKTTNTAPTTF